MILLDTQHLQAELSPHRVYLVPQGRPQLSSAKVAGAVLNHSQQQLNVWLPCSLLPSGPTPREGWLDAQNLHILGAYIEQVLDYLGERFPVAHDEMFWCNLGDAHNESMFKLVVSHQIYSDPGRLGGSELAIGHGNIEVVGANIKPL